MCGAWTHGRVKHKNVGFQEFSAVSTIFLHAVQEAQKKKWQLCGFA
jgi:hypothetical protein